MVCRSCHFDNPSGTKFCGACGTKLEALCPNCQATNPPEFRFCGECGHNLTLSVDTTPTKDLSFDEKLAKIQKYLPGGLTEKILSQRDRIEGERRYVTIMFVDMKGFTPLTEKLGPEETFSLMDKVFELIIHKVHEYEGTVNEMRGDGVLAFFGAPIALEDAPQRAIRSSLAIHRELTRFNDKLKAEKRIPPVLVRIGVNSGPVVVGTVGNDLRVQFTAVGDTINMAARMEQLAEPGTTYVTEDTFRLTEGYFRFEALGEKEVKGKEKPLKVYRVIATRARTTRFDVSAERGLAQFVGRESELELLAKGFEQCKSFRGQAFSLIGEAGVGKSRLLYEFRKALVNENATFLEGKCLSYGRGVPYLPVIDILKTSFRIIDGESDASVREKVKQGLAFLKVEEESALTYLLTLLTVDESTADVTSLGPEKKREKIVEALKRVVLQRGKIEPLIVAIEDLHWIDGSSKDAIGSLLESIADARVLLLLTYRTEFVPSWKRKSYHAQLNLGRLSDHDSLAMVAHIVGSDEISNDLEGLILEKTEGIPLFIEEFVRTLRDLGISQQTDNKYGLAGNVLQQYIPATIQEIIMSRIDLLPHDAREVLQIASVIGREFSHDLLNEVMPLPEGQLLQRLSLLKDSELVYESGVFPVSMYILRHALIQDVCYQSLLRSTRERYHGKVAQALEATFPQTARERPEILAHHFTSAGLVEKAIPYWQKAGAIAIRRSANLEAVSHFEMALELLKTLPANPANVHREIELQIALGPALMAIKGYTAPEVQRAYAKALDLCELLGEVPELVIVLRGLWGNSIVRGELQVARGLAERSLELAQRSQNPSLYIWAHYTSGLTLIHLGETAPAREHFEQGLTLYDSHKRRSHHALQDPGVACLSYLAVDLWLLGYPDQALKTGHEAVSLARSLSHPFSLAYALNITSLVCQLCRAVKESKERADEAEDLCSELGIPYWKAWGPILRGWALTESGKPCEGIQMELHGLAAYTATGAKLVRPYFLCMLAEAYAKEGRVQDGLGVLSESLSVVKETDERWCEAEIHRLQGELLAAHFPEKHGQAEACFQDALKLARRQSAKSWELRSATSLSQLWEKMDRKAEARELLRERYKWFSEGFDSADLKRARELLDRLT